MNPSKNKLYTNIACCIFFLTYLIVAFCDYNNWGIDALLYAGRVVRGDCGNHASLITFEGIALHRFISLFWSGISGTAILRIFWLVSTFIIAICGCTWIRMVARSDVKNLLMVVPMCLMLCFLKYFGYFAYAYRMDYFFLCAIAISITCVLLLREIRGKGKFVVIALLIITLLHIPYLRTNAAILIPFLVYFAIATMGRTYSFIKKMLCSAIITIAVFMGVHLLSMLLPFRPMDAAIAGSELKIAAVFRDDFKRLEEEFANVGYQFPKKNQDNSYQLLRPEFFVNKLTVETSEDKSTSVKTLYFSHWQSNTESMLYARMVQSFYFLHAGYVPEFIREIVQERYPHILSNSELWNWEGVEKSKVKQYIRPTLYLLAMIIFCACCRRGIGSCYNKLFAALLSFLALLYIASFFVFIPTPDSRFHAPSLYLICWPVALSFSNIIIKLKKKVFGSNCT